MSIMDEFINTCFVTDPAGSVTLIDAYLVFKSWYLDVRKERPPPRRIFNIWMEQYFPSDHGRWPHLSFSGIAIKNDCHDQV